MNQTRPELNLNLLRQIALILRIATVSVRNLEDDALVPCEVGLKTRLYLAEAAGLGAGRQMGRRSHAT